MGGFGVSYSAISYYDFAGGERIIFAQKTRHNLAEAVWRSEERFPVVNSYYCVTNGRKRVCLLPMKDSIFNDMAVSCMVGHTAKDLGYSIKNIPKSFAQMRLYIEGLPCIVCANEYGVVFTDVHTKEPLLDGSSRIWEGREEKSLYRVLEKMLSRIRDVYGADYAVSNFI